jgi:hypothetical protein
MAKAHRLSIVGAVIVSFVVAQANVTLFASEDTRVSTDAEAIAPSIAVDQQAATDLASTSLLQIERLRFPLGAEMLATTPALGEAHFTFHLEPRSSTALNAQVYQGRPYRMGRSGSVAAIMIGAAATITGAALLVYANRPDCTVNQFAGGCGYGTKVIGGAVLAGGVVGLFVGALTWR